MVKKLTPIILISLIILVTFLLVSSVLILKKVIIPQAVLQSSGTEFVSYSCPRGEGITCKVTPILECQSPTSTQTVKFRTSVTNGDYSQLNKFVFVDIDEDNIADTCYKRISSTRISDCLGVDKGDTPEGFSVKFRNSKVYICSNDNYEFSQLTTDCDKSITPTEPYKSNNQEVYSGSKNIFTCSENVLIDGISRDKVSYSSDQQGFQRGLTYTLQQGQKIEFSKIEYQIFFEEPSQTQCTTSNGQTIDVNKAICTDSKTKESCIFEQGKPTLKTEKAIGRQICTNGVIRCSSSECLSTTVGKPLEDNTGYYKCAVDSQSCSFIDTTSIFHCSQGEIFDNLELICKPPYLLNVNLDKTILGTQDSIEGKVTISNTNQKNQISLRVTIKDDKGQTVDSDDFFTNSFGERSFSFDPITQTGNYILEVKVFHPIGPQEKKVSFKVTPQLNLLLQPEPDYIQFENEPIKIRASVKSGQEFESVKEWVIDANFEGRKITQDKIEIKPIAKGQIIISTLVEGEGNLEFNVYAIDETGFKTETEKIIIAVKRASILIPIDITPAHNQVTGTYTIKFKTLTADNTLLNTDSNNKVTIILPNACKSGSFCVTENKQIPEVTIQGTKGQYSFVWSFDKPGLYIVDISSFAEGFEPSKSITTSINVRSETLTFDWIPILIGIGVIILAIVGIVVFFIIRGRRQ